MRGLIFPGGREPVLTGARIMLRYPRLSDYEAWATVREESHDFLAPWEPTWAPDELTGTAFRRRIRRYQREIRADEAYPFFIFRTEDAVLIGGCTLHKVRRGVMQSANLGYWIGKRFARQGYMSAAVRLIVPFVFGVLGLHRLEAACIPGNEASTHLLQKAGFREEGYARKYLQIDGVWRDHILFALLEDDPLVG